MARGNEARSLPQLVPANQSVAIGRATLGKDDGTHPPVSAPLFPARDRQCRCSGKRKIACRGDPVEDKRGKSRSETGAARWTLRRSLRRRCGGSSVACALALSVIAILAWIGWATNWRRRLASTHPAYIPMAPNTALCFFLLAIALWLRSLPRGDTRRGRVDAPAACAAIVVVIGLARICELATHLYLSVDRWIFEISSESLGLAPVGKMALFTAVFLLVGGLTLIALIRAGQVAPGARRGRDARPARDRGGLDLPPGLPVRCALALWRPRDPDGAEHGTGVRRAGDGARRRSRPSGVPAPRAPRPDGPLAPAPRVPPLRRGAGLLGRLADPPGHDQCGRLGRGDPVGALGGPGVLIAA